MSLALLNRQPATWDSEAASYLTSVESADGQSLETTVARAINTFVIDCKIRGIWGAIKSSCLLCGARTQAGAIVPLKGNAPTLTSFVGDYNRETGLRRISGSFDTNRNDSTDPQNNKHIAIYPTSLDYGSSASNFRPLISSGSLGSYIALTSAGLRARVNSSSLILTDVTMSAGLFGIATKTASSSQLFYNGRSSIRDINTTTPYNNTLTLWSGSGLSTSQSRICFYSIGEALDLRLLEQCIERFNSSLRNALYPTVLHSEANNWITLAEGYTNRKISATIAKALSDFCSSIDAANLRSKFYRLNLFCGPTLGTALIPLYRGQSLSGTQYGNFFETSFNFTDSSYSELGLLGNGTSSYLDPGILTSTINSLYPNIHFAVYGNNSPTSNKSFIFTGSGSGGSNYALVGPWTTTQWVHHIAGEWNNGGIFENIVSRFGMKIISRTTTSLVRLYSNGSYVDQSTTTVSSSPPALPATQTIKLFANQIQSSAPGGFIDLRSCGYSMGAGMTDSEASAYYTIMQTFQTALGRQV